MVKTDEIRPPDAENLLSDLRAIVEISKEERDLVSKASVQLKKLLSELSLIITIPKEIFSSIDTHANEAFLSKEGMIILKRLDGTQSSRELSELPPPIFSQLVDHVSSELARCKQKSMISNTILEAERKEVKTEMQLSGRRPIAGFTLSLISGVFTLVNTALLEIRLLMPQHVLVFRETFFFNYPNSSLIEGLSVWILFILLALGYTCSIMVLLGACEVRRRPKYGVIVIVFSALSLGVGGGFLVGFVLGTIGGALGIAEL